MRAIARLYLIGMIAQTPQLFPMSETIPQRLKGFGYWAPLITIGFAMFTDGFLYDMLVPLTPLSKAHFLDEGHEEFLYGGYALSVLILVPFFSWLATRAGYKRCLVIGAISQVIATVLFAVAPSFEVLLIARFFQGASAAVTWTVGLALIAESYPDQRIRSFGFMMSAATFGLVLGPMAGGLLFEVNDASVPYHVACFLTLLDLAFRMTLLMHIPRMQIVKNPLATLIRNREVLAAAAVVAMVGWAWSGAIEPFLPGSLVHDYHASATEIGMIFTLSSVAYALVTWLVDEMEELKGLWPTIGLGVIMIALGMPLLAIAPNLLCAGILLSIISIAYAFAINPTLAALADTVDRCAVGAYASVYAIFNLAYSVGTIGGDVATGALIRHFSVETSFLVLSALLLASVPMIRWGFKPRRHAKKA